VIAGIKNHACCQLQGRRLLDLGTPLDQSEHDVACMVESTQIGTNSKVQHTKMMSRVSGQQSGHASGNTEGLASLGLHPRLHDPRSLQ
jgi:hypothetical protein